MDTMQKLFKKGSICVNTLRTLNYNVIVKSYFTHFCQKRHLRRFQEAPHTLRGAHADAEV